MVVSPTSRRGAGRRFGDPGRRPGAGLAGFRRAGGLGGLRADGPESPVSASMQARSVATSRRPSAGLSSAARSTSLITATPPPRRRFACATPGSRAATRSSAQTALYAACQRALQPGGMLIYNLRSARAHRRHTHATVLPATIDGIRAHFGNPTQITLLRMPVSAGSPHEKTVHNGGSARVLSAFSRHSASCCRSRRP